MSFSARPVVARSLGLLLQGAGRAGARRTAAAARARWPEHTTRRERLLVPTAWGSVAVEAHHPDGAGARAAVHVNLHGGGFVLGAAAMDDALCRLIAVRSGSVVVNADYVLAPQHPFPAAPEQVLEVLRWVAGHGEEHGWDGSRLSVGGQSAGGALAAAAARLAWEQQGPPVALQVLHYPPLDLTTPVREKSSPRAKPLLRPWMGDAFDTSYVPDPARRGHRLVSPAGPADTADLTGIAPAVVVVAGDDVLRAEGLRYAARLEACGALVEAWEVPGADHGYDAFDDALALESYTRIADHVARAVRRP